MNLTTWWRSWRARRRLRRFAGPLIVRGPVLDVGDPRWSSVEYPIRPGMLIRLFPGEAFEVFALDEARRRAMRGGIDWPGCDDEPADGRSLDLTDVQPDRR